MATIGNMTLLERPMRVSTLISTVRTALRARQRQYEMLGHLRERRRAEDRLARDALVLSEVQDSVIVTDLEGIITFWNKGATHLFGWTAEEMIGKPLVDRLPEPLRSDAAAWIERIAKDGTEYSGEWQDQRKDGSTVWTETSTRRIADAAGKPIGIMGVSRDISDRKRSQAAIEEREAERLRLFEIERAARSAAETASRMKDEFLATLSHELRTPLSAILGWSQMLRRAEVKPETLAEGLSTIERNARAQTQIIDDLLDMSRIISGKVSIDAQRINLSSVIRDAIATVRPAAAAKGIEIVFEQPAGARHPILGDTNRLQQVFWNLISNAVKFTPRGGGPVEIRIDRRHSQWQVDLIDKGEGIAEEFLPYVFDRFRQADASTTRKHGGLGLGLAIVKQLVEIHGGKVRVRSEGLGKGSTFTVSLPVRIIHDDIDPVGTPTAISVADTSLQGVTSSVREGATWDISLCDDIRGKTVVIVDDEADARALLRQLLTDCGVTVLVASTAAEAVELVKVHRPDVLVSDIGMPGADGYDLLREVRRLNADGGGATPAIALTAYARAEDRMKAVRAGFQMHVPKPVEPAELMTMIASLAGKADR
jgi:PAS domain S-box-containing protein